MRLLTKTSLNFISVSVIFFLIGSIIMYFSVRNIVAEDLQSRLLEKQNEFFNGASKDKLENLASDFLFVEKTQKELIQSFSDTALIINEKYMLYRKLDFLYLADNQNYKISILQSQSQSDLLIMKISIMNIGFAMLFFLIVFFVNRQSINSALKVFYSTINKLEDFQVNKAQVLALDTAEVDEVKKLNAVFEKMSEQIRKDFEVQKEYTENVAHELQTPLAIISSKADELMQADNLTKEQIQQLDLLLETTNRLSRINQSLIFLAKIDNRFYTEASTLLLNDLIKEKLVLFSSVIEEKDLKLKLDLNEDISVYMNPYLAETLVVNLLKNAIVHNKKGGDIRIKLEDRCLIISNSGEPLAFPEVNIFNRFSRSENNKESLGIGLSIVQRICEMYNINIGYKFQDNHIFTIKF